MRHAKSNRGFSTAEMLLATMILGLSMTLLMNGAAVIQSIYRRMLATADAQMIFSQTETRLRSDLSKATKYDADADGYVTKYSISSVEYTLTVRPDRDKFPETDYPDYVLYKEYDYNGNSQLDQLSLKNVRRLEGLRIPNAPVILFKNDCFQVYGLRVEYQDRRTGNWETLCGEEPPPPDAIDDASPQFVIRALQPVKSGE